MNVQVASLYRHPVKGLTPEALEAADLVAGLCFPNDRRWAVEVGPSGFDPAAPKHISKMRFTVLARFPVLARLKTRYDDASGRFFIGDAHGFGMDVDLSGEEGRAALARFLQAYLADETQAPMKVLEGPGEHRFMDSGKGFVSAINLNSVRAVSEALGRPVDPLRFRANIYYEGAPAWSEDALKEGDRLRAGNAVLQMLKPIERCVATDVDLDKGVRDIDMVDELRTRFGRITLGVYFAVQAGGRVACGDAIAQAE